MICGHYVCRYYIGRTIGMRQVVNNQVPGDKRTRPPVVARARGRAGVRLPAACPGVEALATATVAVLAAGAVVRAQAARALDAAVGGEEQATATDGAVAHVANGQAVVGLGEALGKRAATRDGGAVGAVGGHGHSGDDVGDGSSAHVDLQGLGRGGSPRRPQL